jgi:leucyl aminopeptidase (aminopeptidase T)
VQCDASPPSAPLAFFTFMMLLVPVTKWEPHGITLARYCYVMRHETKVQIVTPYRVTHLQRYGVTVHGNVTSVYPPFVVMKGLEWDGPV